MGQIIEHGRGALIGPYWASNSLKVVFLHLDVLASKAALCLTESSRAQKHQAATARARLRIGVGQWSPFGLGAPKRVFAESVCEWGRQSAYSSRASANGGRQDARFSNTSANGGCQTRKTRTRPQTGVQIAKLRNIVKLQCSAILPGCILLIYNTIKPCMRVHSTGYIISRVL